MPRIADRTNWTSTRAMVATGSNGQRICAFGNSHVWRVSSVLRLSGLSQPPPVAASTMSRALTRGTAVHAFAEAHAYGEAMRNQPDLNGYVEGVRNWFIEMQPVVLFTERRIVSRSIRLTGRLDLGVLLDGHPTIVDYATGSIPAHKGIQVAGYVKLASGNMDLRVMAKGKPWRRAVLELPGNGRYHFYGENRLGAQDYYLFDAALALVSWRFVRGYITQIDPEFPADDCDD